jgi:prevent-host-death family protein
MSGKSYQIVDINEAKARLDEFFSRVAEMNDRVIVTRKGSNDQCVLVSAAELDGLEKAIDILSQSTAATSVREQVARIATAAGSAYTAPSH